MPTAADPPTRAPEPSGSPRRLFVAAVLLAAVLMAIAVGFHRDPSNDVSNYYGRLVREFAAGRWSGAFFHLIPPLVPSLAGVVAWLGVPPFAALKLVSGAFFVAGLWPLARLLRRALPADQAAWGCLIYAVAPRLVGYAGMGLLDSAKTFFLLWLADQWLVYVERPRRRTLVWLGIGLAGLSLTRGEGLFFLPLVLLGILSRPWLAGVVTGVPVRSWRALVPAVVHSLAVAGIVGLLCLPWALHVRAVTGWPALDSRQTQILRAVLSRCLPGRVSPSPPSYWGQAPEAMGQAPVDIRPEDRRTPMRSAREAVKGLEPLFLGLTAIGVAAGGRRRRWGRVDAACLAAILFNLILFACRGFITKRYIGTTVPFLLPWAVPGLAWLRVRLLDRLHPRLFPALGVVAVLAFAAEQADDLIALDTPPEQFARWLEPRRHAVGKAQPVRLVSAPHGKDYHDGRLPIIGATTSQYAFRAAADWVHISHRRRFTPDEVRILLCRQHADLLIVDRDLRRTCPALDPEAVPWLRPLPDQPEQREWTAYAVDCTPAESGAAAEPGTPAEAP